MAVNERDGCLPTTDFYADGYAVIPTHRWIALSYTIPVFE
jgi:hypothetical protein